MAITQLVRVSSRKLVLIGLLLVGFGLTATPTQAAYRIHLDQATVEKGYTVTVPSGMFSLAVPAGSFFEPTTVSIKHLSSTDLAQANADIETDWDLVGKIKNYHCSMSTPQTLSTPVWVSEKISLKADQNYTLAFFDRNNEVWKAVPSRVDWLNGTIKAALPFPSVSVAAFSIPGYAPQKIINFESAETALGTLNAVSAVIIDSETGEVLFSKNSNEVRSIASMTKLATSWVALQYATDWNQIVMYSSAWDQEGGVLYAVNGDQLTVGDLFYATLVGSANNTAVALGNIFMDQPTFVSQMNSVAHNLGLPSTHFEEPSGLAVGNVSTAHEYALLARAALNNFDLLAVTTTKSYTFNASLSGAHTIHTTNNLLNSDLYVTGGKTGYIDEAGYCLMIQSRNSAGHQIITVVMGEPSSADRFSEAYDLTHWAFDNYTWN